MHLDDYLFLETDTEYIIQFTIPKKEMGTYNNYLNYLRNWNDGGKRADRFKGECKGIILNKLCKNNTPKLDAMNISLTYEYDLENRLGDLDNISSWVNKLTQDALVEYKLIHNDGQAIISDFPRNILTYGKTGLIRVTGKILKGVK